MMRENEPFCMRIGSVFQKSKEYLLKELDRLNMQQLKEKLSLEQFDDLYFQANLPRNLTGIFKKLYSKLPNVPKNIHYNSPIKTPRGGTTRWKCLSQEDSQN